MSELGLRKVSHKEFVTLTNKRAKTATDDAEVSSEDADAELSLNGSEPDAASDRLQRMAAAMKTVIECMGEDVDREGLERTPMRAGN